MTQAATVERTAKKHDRTSGLGFRLIELGVWIAISYGAFALAFVVPHDGPGDTVSALVDDALFLVPTLTMSYMLGLVFDIRDRGMTNPFLLGLYAYAIIALMVALTLPMRSVGNIPVAPRLVFGLGWPSFLPWNWITGCPC